MDYLKEEIGWLKLLLVLLFTSSVSWAGWMVEKFSWPSVPDNVGPLEAYLRFCANLN